MVYWPRHRLAERQGRRNLQSIYFFLIFPQYFMFFFSKLSSSVYLICYTFKCQHGLLFTFSTSAPSFLPVPWFQQNLAAHFCRLPPEFWSQSWQRATPRCSRLGRDYPLCRCSWSGFLWGEPGWRQQRINWVFQLLIVEPFNILFHIRENKELKSIKDKIQNQPATFISWGTTSTTDKKRSLGCKLFTNDIPLCRSKVHRSGNIQKPVNFSEVTNLHHGQLCSRKEPESVTSLGKSLCQEALNTDVTGLKIVTLH